MKVLEAILSKKCDSNLIEIKGKKIKNIIASAILNAEEQKMIAESRVQELTIRLGDDNVDVRNTLQQIIDAKETTSNQELVLKYLKEIQEKLEQDYKENK